VAVIWDFNHVDHWQKYFTCIGLSCDLFSVRCNCWSKGLIYWCVHCCAFPFFLSFPNDNSWLRLVNVEVTFIWDNLQVHAAFWLDDCLSLVDLTNNSTGSRSCVCLRVFLLMKHFAEQCAASVFVCTCWHLLTSNVVTRINYLLSNCARICSALFAIAAIISGERIVSYEHCRTPDPAECG